MAWGAAVAAGGLVVAAAVVGRELRAQGVPLYAGAAPLFGRWLPHVGPGTPLAVALAVAVVARGPGLAERLPWRRLLAVGYGTAVTWTFSLAMVDGWGRGFADRLTGEDEYLSEVPGVTSVAAAVHGFSARILDFQPDSWSTHVAGHPPGALLSFVALDRAGFGGGVAAAAACVLVGSSVAISVPVALRALGAEQHARRAVPFLALFPGAVWIGVSADGLFAGVTSAGVALLAIAATGRNIAAAVGAGVLLGLGLYLSYGLVLMALPALAVLVITREWRTAVKAAAGAALVVGGFSAAGFWWLDGYHLVVQRYYQGIGADRPSTYWAWANLAALVLAAGPPAIAGLTAIRGPAAVRGLTVRGRAAVTGRAAAAGRAAVRGRVTVLPVSALLAVLVADASGLSKAETERIWLPFAVWLTAAAAALPHPRRWLAMGAVTALAVNHLVLTGW